MSFQMTLWSNFIVNLVHFVLIFIRVKFIKLKTDVQTNQMDLIRNYYVMELHDARRIEKLWFEILCPSNKFNLNNSIQINEMNDKILTINQNRKFR